MKKCQILITVLLLFQFIGVYAQHVSVYANATHVSCDVADEEGCNSNAIAGYGHANINENSGYDITSIMNIANLITLPDVFLNGKAWGWIGGATWSWNRFSFLYIPISGITWNPKTDDQSSAGLMTSIEGGCKHWLDSNDEKSVKIIDGVVSSVLVSPSTADEIDTTKYYQNSNWCSMNTHVGVDMQKAMGNGSFLMALDSREDEYSSGSHVTYSIQYGLYLSPDDFLKNDGNPPISYKLVSNKYQVVMSLGDVGESFYKAVANAGINKVGLRVVFLLQFAQEGRASIFYSDSSAITYDPAASTITYNVPEAYMQYGAPTKISIGIELKSLEKSMISNDSNSLLTYLHNISHSRYGDAVSPPPTGFNDAAHSFSQVNVGDLNKGDMRQTYAFDSPIYK